MPNEKPDPELSPSDIHRIFTTWQDEEYVRGLDGQEAAAKLDAQTEGVLRELERLRQKEEAQVAAKPKTVFETPPSAQARLDAQRQEYERRWEIEAAKSTPRVMPKLREELQEEGLRGDP